MKNYDKNPDDIEIYFSIYIWTLLAIFIVTL